MDLRSPTFPSAPFYNRHPPSGTSTPFRGSPRRQRAKFPGGQVSFPKGLALSSLAIITPTLAVNWAQIGLGVLGVAFLFVCIVMVLTVLIQKPQGGGLAGAFGSGAGSGQTAFGTKTGDALTVFTIIVFALYVILAITLNIVTNKQIHAAPATPEAETSTPTPASTPATTPADTTATPATTTPTPETTPSTTPTPAPTPAPTPTPTPESAPAVPVTTPTPTNPR